jgi:hypothetical protein
MLSIIGALKNAEITIPVSLLRNYKSYSQRVKRAISILKVDFKNDEDYPYNKGWTDSVTYGGKDLSATFKGELFIGTNFDCNHDTFNYKGLAEVTAGN